MIQNSIVLLGAGNAHVQVLRKWAMAPIPNAELTLVNETLRVPYSGMIPGFISGQYSQEQTEIDLSTLCGVAGIRLIPHKAKRIDAESKTIHLEGRPAIRYDLASLNVGSHPSLPPGANLIPHSIAVKPLHLLLEKLKDFETWLEKNKGEGHLVVVGSGAGGTELALAIRKRFSGHTYLKISLVEANDRVLPHYPQRVSTHFAKILQDRGISFHANARVVKCSENTLHLESGAILDAHAVVWTTRAEPTPLIERSSLKVDKRGFLLVHDSLQSISHPTLFGTGDCVTLESHRDLPKAGVFAVRQGPVLWNNLQAFIEKRSLKNYRPQKLFLTILNSSDEKAVLSYGELSLRSGWAWKLKQTIDARWMQKFQDIQPLQMEPETPMRCGGCGSKIAGDTLHRALSRLDIPEHPQVLMGCLQKEDAVVTQLGEGVEVNSVDFFRSFLPDPFLFGRIAAQNALSDLYAMNATPVHAQAIVTLPLAKDSVQEETLYQMLSGAIASLKGAGATLSGGHTAEGSDLALGFSVSGVATGASLFKKTAIRPNQKLILTQPLGSGALLAALMRGECRSSWYENLVPWLLCSNQSAAKIFDAFGVVACTDVTGFGFAGHLFEMLAGGQLSARLYPHEIPLYDGFTNVTSKGIVSSLHEANAKWAIHVSAELHSAALFDPQTSGGLLAAVDPEPAFEILSHLKNSGYTHAAIVGEIIEAEGAPHLC